MVLMLPNKSIVLCLSAIIALLATSSCLPVLSEETKEQPALSLSNVSNKPILRIETGMHTSMIRRISVDAKQRILATASDDKTVRIWAHSASLSDRTLSSSFTSTTLHSKDRSLITSTSLGINSTEGNNTPTLLRIIRPPIGEGDEGKLYAVALNPEGTILATGGWTSKDGLSNSIYIFDVSTGILQYSLKGLEHRIRHLTFSFDGTYLVATLGGGKGIRVYQKRNDTYILFAEDQDYAADSYWAEFNPIPVGTRNVGTRGGVSSSYQLATTCDDGHIRLYTITEKGLSKPIKVKTKSGKQPYSLSFSPEGKKIAVGYDDLPRIDIYSIIESKVEYLFSPDTTFLKKEDGNLARVSYSGDFLYAGGTYSYLGDKAETFITPILKFPIYSSQIGFRRKLKFR